MRRLDLLKDPADPLDPFQFPGTKVTPTLASSLPKAAQATVYFVVYPSTADQEKSTLVVQYFRDGVEIGRQTPELKDSQKDASGGIPMLASAKLEPGQYEVRVTVIQGKATAGKHTSAIRMLSATAGETMPKHDHHKAAEHHDEAAKSHRNAAAAHEKGHQADASQHSQLANDHSAKAYEASQSAHAKTKGPKKL